MRLVPIVFFSFLAFLMQNKSKIKSKGEEIKSMSFENFITEIKKMVKEYLGEEVKVEDKSVLKNNGVIFTGIVILKENQNCVPNIYLNGYYEQYKTGKCLCDIVCEIVRYYEEHKIEQKINISGFSKFESAKRNICFKLINYEKNKELLKQIPYIQYMDLAIVFYCMVDNECLGNGSILVRNEHLTRWQVSINELKEVALNNTPRRLKGSIMPMEDVICDLMRRKMIFEIENSIEQQTDSRIQITEDMVEPIIQEMLEKIYTEAKGPKMYVAGNESKNYGAAVILYDDFLATFAEKIHSDFYILPSSVHEVILIPVENDESEISRLKDMVYEVNHTELATEEILSDSVYLFKCSSGMITKL